MLDFAELKRSSISFFDIERTESVFSRWSRARTRAAKVGKGLSKDEKARKLALQHWLEAVSGIYTLSETTSSSPPARTNFIPSCYRLILDIDTGIIFSFIMSNGCTVKVDSPSFIGKICGDRNKIICIHD